MNKVSKLARFARTAGAVVGLAFGCALTAQTVTDAEVPQAELDLPSNLQIFGKADPNVRKPTAIVNDAVLTGTDVDQRLNMILAFEQMKLTDEQRQQLRLQVLRQLIDETLKIQEAKAQEIEITADEINQSFVKVARNFNRSPDDFRTFLRQVGSSERSIRRQIEGELAWTRLLRRKVEPFINVGDEEVQAIIDRMQAAKGSDEYNLREIYLSATPEQSQQVYAGAQKLIEQMRGGAPFEAIARTYSEATTRATGGDLGWVRPSVLPAELATAASQMQIGQVAGPIEVPGGFSIIYMVDKRQVLSANPRDAKLNLRQLSIKFAPGTTEAGASARAAEFAQATKTIKGCGDVKNVADSINAEVVDRADIRVGDLPPALQEMLLSLQIGETTQPFGNVADGVRVLVLCGRDDPQTGSLPSKEQIQGQLEQARVNLRAERMLRDLRRDALVDYR